MDSKKNSRESCNDMKSNTKKGEARTVLGNVSASDLGPVDAHTHVIRTGGPLVDNNKDFLLSNKEKAIEELKDYKAHAGGTLVDMMPAAPGRSAGLLMDISRATGIHIVSATGFVDWALYPGTLQWLETESVETITSLIIAEIIEGIDAYNYTGPVIKRLPARAGVIKVSTGYQVITSFQKKMIRIAAEAHRSTGVPISVHTENGTCVIELIEILFQEGVPPESIIVAHTFLNPDPSYQHEIAQSGIYLIQDGPGRVKYYPESKTIQQIERFLSDGFGKQLLLASDCSKASYWKALGGGPGLTYILSKFVPRLTNAGIPEPAIQAMLIDNPARAFSSCFVDS